MASRTDSLEADSRAMTLANVIDSTQRMLNTAIKDTDSAKRIAKEITDECNKYVNSYGPDLVCKIAKNGNTFRMSEFKSKCDAMQNSLNGF